jgi:hypothetical protein
VSNIPGLEHLEKEGWEIVRFDNVSIDEWFIDSEGRIVLRAFPHRSVEKKIILRKIEKPKQYRPFANAAEFRPHRDRWLTRKDKSDPTHYSGACRVIAYCDNHLWLADVKNSTYKEELDHGRCFDDDGSPFGVEVQS